MLSPERKSRWEKRTNKSDTNTKKETNTNTYKERNTNTNIKEGNKLQMLSSQRKSKWK